ncbi:sensor histidine kinase [Bradyrhizobium sp. HKCCYLR20261]|uniref:sensor histidine kinase n=1 Tax=Bradyrhizobium sp. HKCCYLR20261 TaxID=3420760 RepID=UPI003EBA5DC3
MVARKTAPWLLSVLGIAVFTGLLLILNRSTAASLVPIAYLIPVIFAATRWGIGPAIVASIAGMAAADFFFFAPIYSFRVDDPQEAVDLLLFLIVSLVSSNLASRLRRETENLSRREREIHELYDFSRRLAACFTIADLVSAIQDHLQRTFGHPAAFFVATSQGHYEPSEACLAPPDVQACAATMNAGLGPLARSLFDERRRELWVMRAMSSGNAVHGVIAINIGPGSSQILETRRRRIGRILEEALLTLQRLDVGQAMERAKLNLQEQLLRDAFHGTLSHELCSPLVAIKGSASVLETIPNIRQDARVSSLVQAILGEAERLDDYIQNLLRATRVSAGGLVPRLEWADPKDIVNDALGNRGRQLAAHCVETRFAERLPLIHVDSGLVAEACGQILENAAKYSPSGSTISVEVRAEAKYVVVQVVDQGVGITPEEQQQLGHRSFRGSRHRASVPGSGLGFWIASTFVQANHGRISVQSRGSGQGTTVSIALPASDLSSRKGTDAANE